MFVRRRPLLRAAVIGGGAYVAGKKMSQRSAQQSQQEAGQDQRISDLEQKKDSGPAAAAGAADRPMSEQLKDLTALHEQGDLSDAEFSAAKSKLLGI